MKVAAFARRFDFRDQISQPLSGGRITNHVASDRSIGNSRRILTSSQPDGNDESLTRSRLVSQKKFAIIPRVTARSDAMAHSNQTDKSRVQKAPAIPHSEPAGGTASLEAAMVREKNPVKRFFKLLGPGLITGASDDDPSGIGTYAVAGAAFGFATLWTALFTLPLMVDVQLTCARLGMVSHPGLAPVCRPRHAGS